MSGIAPMMPAISEDGDFIIEVQSRCGTYWKAVIAPPTDNIDYQHGKPYLLSDYVHASILADLHRKTTNRPTRVNALKVCYVHFKSHRLDPDI
ncbi:hypothetical protein [Thioalkalivibrio sp. HK1]|uniref:hypothetical protein n=1 Tax=Thioalkalivibrio sp. HK1 TaxID=1469245 RepID=UPI0004B0BE09|nr:hypothetical protein [Thioalkalivibrio sp. HK1]